jgi:hypothetical protein
VDLHPYSSVFLSTSETRPRLNSAYRLPRPPTFPDVGRLCVIVPIKTENRLHFSVRLDDSTPEVPRPDPAATKDHPRYTTSTDLTPGPAGSAATAVSG